MIEAGAVRRAVFTLTGATVQEAVAWIATQMTEIGATERQSFGAQLCTEELLLNAISHGKRDPLSASLTLEALPESLRLTLKDDGAPFSLVEAPQREVAQAIKSAQPGGWGLQLVRRFARDVRYQRVGNCNVVLLDFTP